MSRAPLRAGPPPYSRPIDPTDDELYIFVTALQSYLSLPEQSINRQGLAIMGDYLMQRDVLARLKGREDVSAKILYQCEKTDLGFVVVHCHYA